MIEMNKIIAEFMGLEYVSSLNKELGYPGWWRKNTPVKLRKIPGYHKLTNYIGRSHNCLKYDESWDWLMPAVEKIENLGYNTLISDFQIQISFNGLDCAQRNIVNIFNDEDSTKLKEAYKAVVEFIKWFNNQK